MFSLFNSCHFNGRFSCQIEIESFKLITAISPNVLCVLTKVSAFRREVELCATDVISRRNSKLTRSALYSGNGELWSAHARALLYLRHFKLVPRILHYFTQKMEILVLRCHLKQLCRNLLVGHKKSINNHSPSPAEL